MPNPVTALALQLRRVTASSAGVALVRADLMPVVAAVLTTHLAGSQRTVPASEFVATLEADLDELRDHGFDLPRTAQEYLAEWVRQGVIVRRPGDGRDETVELSAPASVALRFLADLVAPRSSVTSSRLATVSHLVDDLSTQTDPDTERRLAALRAQRAALDVEIARAEQGHVPVMDADTALERLSEVVTLASQIPADFAQVSAALDELNRDLRERIITASGPRGEVLDDVFAGVDLVERSDAGRTFNAFHAMLLDPEHTAHFDDAVSGLLDRDFALTLTTAERQLLRDLFGLLHRESRQVRGVITGLSRSLRAFVETHAWQEHQRLADALAEAQSATLAALRHAPAHTRVPWQLDATSVPLASVGSWRLHRPDSVRTADPVVVEEAEPLDLEMLRAQVRVSEIDFAELHRAIADVVDQRGVASIGEVLAAHPATQGLASVVGLVLLAQRFGTDADGVEQVVWQSGSGRGRRMVLPRLVFTHVPEQWTERAA